VWGEGGGVNFDDVETNCTLMDVNYRDSVTNTTKLIQPVRMTYQDWN